MKILYLLTRELGATGTALRLEHEREHDVELVDLRVRTDYGRVVEAIDAADRVVSW